MSAWIATADSLPDDDTTVLVAMDDGEVWTAFMDAGAWRYVSGEPIASASITHWMHLPAHPGDQERSA